jgi:hypothetical protein
MAEIKNILIEGTAKTPQIDFNRLSGELILSGKSIPENAAKVYEPLLDWINDYIKSPRPTTHLRLNLEYFNSASSIWFAKLVKALSKIKEDDYVLYIHLYFDIEDFDSLESEELKDMVSSLVDKIGDAKVSISIKTHGTDSDGKIIRESTILI